MNSPMPDRLLGLVVFLGVGLLTLCLAPRTATPEMQRIDETKLSEITGSSGLGVQLNLRLGVGSTWNDYGDDGGLSDDTTNDFEIEDEGGKFGGGAQGWLKLHEIYGTVTPKNNDGDGTDDNQIFLDANSNFIQFSAPSQFSGISITIDHISVTEFSGSSNEGSREVASITIGDNVADGDSNYLDGTANVDLHNTRLQLF